MSTLTVGQRLGPYEVAASIGAGGMGEVYRAFDPRLGRDVAIKVSAAQFTERFEREARAVAALNHPNICTLYDVGPNYLVMELIEGETLKGPLPLATALNYACQIARALEAAHDKGIVHRDLKPGNIKIKPDGSVKVLDFGLAKICEPVSGNQNPESSPTLALDATRAGIILGSAAYMSPEQARGEPVDQRADIWAFGVVLYEMLVGRRLFEAKTVSDTLASVLVKEPDLDRVPTQLRPLLRHCLAKDPQQRLHHIADARLLLEETSVSAPVSPPGRSWPGVVAMVMAAVFGLALMALAFVHFREKPHAAEIVRFAISPPAQHTFPSNDAILSPNGRYVAFRVTDPDGRNQLWIRSLDSLTSRLVAGTEDVGNVSFWSPDSRFLGFQVEGKLKKVDVAGGLPQTVCDIPAPPGSVGAGLFRAGAWSRDGVILFGTAATGLWRVPEAGGAPSPVTRLDTSRREIFHAGPYFLPDGRRFLYNRIAPGEKGHGIYFGSLDLKPEEQSSRRLLAGESSVVYAHTSGQGSDGGYVIFARQGLLMAQPFDLSRLELTGEALPIAHGMGSGAQRSFSVSTTGTLAYKTGVRGGRPGTITQLTWLNREGKPIGTAGEPGGYDTVALSPDRSRAAVSLIDRQGASRPSGISQSNIWVHEFDRGTSVRLTSEQATDSFATWSPDGSRLVFASERDGSVYNLYRKDSNGAGNESLLLKSSEDKFPQDWSQDGRFLLYSVTVSGQGNRPPSSHDLWVLPLTPAGDAGLKFQPYLTTAFDEVQGRFSPDGRFVAYGSNASGRDEIYVQPFPTASAGKWMVSRGGGITPRWRSDGKELFYISGDSKMMAVEVSTNAGFRAGIPKALFHAPISGQAFVRWGSRYDVSADGQKFLINSIPAVADAEVAPPITVVMNWTALLKK